MTAVATTSSAGTPPCVTMPIKISTVMARRNANTGLNRIPPAIVHKAQFGPLSISADSLEYARSRIERGKVVSQIMVGELLAARAAAFNRPRVGMRGNYDGTLPRRLS